MKNVLRNTLVVIVSVSLIIIGINAFAHSGMGWGHHGSGWHHQDGYYPCNASRMTQEEYEQVEQNRAAFFRETQGIRDSLYEKGRDLENELAKTEPDVAKASQLQKEISDLRAQLDQKRIEHVVEMKKLNPDAGRGYMHGNRMMGDGSYSGGNCWQ